MMRRVNTFEVRPLRQSDQVLLFELLDASAALWNELTYARRQAFFDNQDIWQVNPDDYRSRYKGVLGSATAQQVIRKNDEAWRSFFALLKQNENPSPPGYWKDGDERDLRMLIRNDQYTLQWGTVRGWKYRSDTNSKKSTASVIMNGSVLKLEATLDGRASPVDLKCTTIWMPMRSEHDNP